jgi:uncharacterized Zn-finger protein
MTGLIQVITSLKKIKKKIKSLIKVIVIYFIAGTGSAEKYLKSSPRRFHCHLCPRSYVYKGDRNVHLNLIHGKDSMPVICNYCGRQYKNKKSLYEHNRVACTGPRPQ